MPLSNECLTITLVSGPKTSYTAVLKTIVKALSYVLLPREVFISNNSKVPFLVRESL